MKSINSLDDIVPGSILVDYEDTVFMILQVERTHGLHGLHDEGIDIHFVESDMYYGHGRIINEDLRNGYYKFLCV